MNDDLNKSRRAALEDLRTADRILRALTPEIEETINNSSLMGGHKDHEHTLPFSTQSEFLEAQNLASKALDYLGRSNPNPIIELYSEQGAAHDNLLKARDVNRFVRHAFWDIYNEDEALKALVEPLYCDEDTVELDGHGELAVKNKWANLNNILIGIAAVVSILTAILKLIFS